MFFLTLDQGTTPHCSTIETALHSVCQQLSYNLEVPMESIPEEFVPLKNFFLILLGDAAKKGMSVLILLDSLDIFFRNSFQNGATSWYGICQICLKMFPFFFFMKAAAGASQRSKDRHHHHKRFIANLILCEVIFNP